MSDANQTSSRIVLRRISRRHCSVANPIIVTPEAFRPNKNDLDGLSVFLSLDDGGVSPGECANTGRGSATEYLVVALREVELSKLGLLIVVDTEEGAPKGHAYIPGINWQDYSTDPDLKRKMKELAAQLAEIATRSILFPPTGD